MERLGIGYKYNQYGKVNVNYFMTVSRYEAIRVNPLSTNNIDPQFCQIISIFEVPSHSILSRSRSYYCNVKASGYNTVGTSKIINRNVETKT